MVTARYQLLAWHPAQGEAQDITLGPKHVTMGSVLYLTHVSLPTHSADIY